MINNNTQIPYYDLNQLIPFNIINQIHENFNNISNMNFVIQDNEGKNIINNHKYLKFCSKIKANQELCQYCSKTAEIAKIMAINARRPIVYKCFAGFVLIAVPILIDHEAIGTIFSGQVLVNDEELNSIEQFYSVPDNFLIDNNLNSIYYDSKRQCKSFSLSQLNIYANILYSISNYIAVLCYSRIINNNLNYYKRLNQEKDEEISLLKYSEEETIIKLKQKDLNTNFIYNTLNNINCMAILENAEQTSDLIICLSNLIRGHLNRIESFISLNDELCYINNFIKIKKMSLWNKVKVNIDIEPVCLACKIPPLCLYAFVENAFIHGLEAKEDTGHFSLSTHLNNNKVYIEIYDDGIGINNETMKNITKDIPEKFNINGSHYLGIKSTISILKFYYNKDVYFDISSIPYKGTTVTIIIPYII